MPIIKSARKRVKTTKKVAKHVQDPKDANTRTVNGVKYKRFVRLTNEQRKTRVQEKINKYLKERKK